MTEEKSGIDLLKELIDEVKLLNRRYSVIEQNTKELLSRANIVSNTGLKAKKAELMINSKPALIKSTSPEPQISVPVQEPQAGYSQKQANTKVIGKIKNRDGAILIGVRVKVYNEQNQVVKDTKTNRAGDWMCFLPAGSYAASYYMEGQVNANAVFSVSPEEKIVRVAQPQT